MTKARNIRKILLAAVSVLVLVQGALAQPAWENPPAWYGAAPLSLPASLPPSGPAGGDLGGTYPNPTVVSIADVTTGTLAAANGGTGIASYAIGDLLVATGATTLSRVADVATGAVFVSGGVGTAPLWSTTSASKFGSVALGGATIGTDALGVTGTSTLNFGTLGASSTVSGLSILGTWNDAGTTFKGALLVNVTQTAAASQSLLGDFQVAGVTKISLSNTGRITSADNITSGGNVVANSSSNFSWSGSRGIITSPAAASLQLGQGDIDTAPVAQTLRSQGALAGGTSNVAGANWTFIASPGKGTGVGGSFIFQVAPAGSTGTAVNAPATALTIDSTKLATFVGSITAANFAAASSNWTPSDASGAGVTLSCADTCKYARIGPFVYIFGDILVGANASATQVKIGGMPTAALGVNNPGSWVMSDIVAAGDIGLVSNGTTNFNVFTSTGANRTWVSLSGQTIFFSGFYAVN